MRPFNRKDLHSIKIALESDNDFYNSSIRLDITRINLFCSYNIFGTWSSRNIIFIFTTTMDFYRARETAMMERAGGLLLIHQSVWIRMVSDVRTTSA